MTFATLLGTYARCVTYKRKEMNMINLEKTSRTTYTGKLNDLNASARGELSLLLQKHGIRFIDAAEKCYATFISSDCEELLADREFEQRDYPLILIYRTDDVCFMLGNSSPYPTEKIVPIDSTDDLCILVDYLINKFEN